MSHKLRNPEQVCIAYAEASESVRIFTRTLNGNRCEGESKGEIGMSGYREGAEESCLSKHWSIVVVNAGHGNPKEEPGMAYEDMCDACKTRLQAFNDRRQARKVLGAAKRAVEAVGKRLKAVTA